MNKWFDETFLPSLFDRAGANNITWITAKQCDVARRYFKDTEEYTIDFGADVCRRRNLTYQWQGRKVSLWVERNGAGRINFSATEKENQHMIESEKQRENERFINRVEKLAKRNPERFAKELNELLESYNSLKQWQGADDFDAEDERQLAEYARKIDIMQNI